MELIRLYGRLAVFWRGVTLLLIKTVTWLPKITFKGLGIALVCVVVPILVLWETIQHPNVIVEPISAPPALANMGYTPDVVTRRLIDSIQEFGKGEDPTMGRILPDSSDEEVSPLVELSRQAITEDNPDAKNFIKSYEENKKVDRDVFPHADDWSKLDFVVPVMGVSIKAVAAYLRNLCWAPITVSGELLYAESDEVVSLRLRVNGKKLLDVPRKVNRTETDKLLEDGAYEVLKKVEPRILALYHYNRGLDFAVQGRRKEAQEEYDKAYNMKQP